MLPIAGSSHSPPNFLEVLFAAGRANSQFESGHVSSKWLVKSKAQSHLAVRRNQEPYTLQFP